MLDDKSSRHTYEKDEGGGSYSPFHVPTDILYSVASICKYLCMQMNATLPTFWTGSRIKHQQDVDRSLKGQ